jgi:hypothetical protein
MLIAHIDPVRFKPFQLIAVQILGSWFEIQCRKIER